MAGWRSGFPLSPDQQWTAIFLAFQSQAWHTDDTTGHTIAEPQPGPGPQPGPEEPDHSVRIIGALVNPKGGGTEIETVTILNATPNTIDLSGWQIADKLNTNMDCPVPSRRELLG